VRESLAGAEADLHAAESVVRVACALDGEGDDLGLPSAIAKVLASEVAWAIVDRGVQLMGGAGFLEDAGMARRLRDVRVTRIFEGSNDVLRLHLASATLGWELDGREGALFAALREVKGRLGFKLFQDQRLQTNMADAIVAQFASAAVRLRGDEGPIARYALLRLERRLSEAIVATRDDRAEERALLAGIDSH
jgi:hypothetical protein